MRPLYAGLAVMMFALGVIGAFLPVMPTTIFVILSLYFASKSSPKLALKIKQSSIVKEYYDEDARSLSMTLFRKIRLLIVVGLTLSLAFILVDVLWVRVFLIILYVLKVLTFIFIVQTKKAT